MDEPTYQRRVSHPLEDSDSKIRRRTRSQNTAGIAGADRQDKNFSDLLGRRHCSHRSAQFTTAQRRRLSGNDRLRPALKELLEVSDLSGHHNFLHIVLSRYRRRTFLVRARYFLSCISGPFLNLANFLFKPILSLRDNRLGKDTNIGGEPTPSNAGKFYLYGR